MFNVGDAVRILDGRDIPTNINELKFNTDMVSLIGMKGTVISVGVFDQLGASDRLRYVVEVYDEKRQYMHQWNYAEEWLDQYADISKSDVEAISSFIDGF